MIRRPPRSTRTDTLFPYTTLFRSLVFSLRELYKAAALSGSEYRNSNPLQLASSTAFFTLFALPPNLIILISVLGLIVRPDMLRGELFSKLSAVLGEKSTETVNTIFSNFRAMAGDPLRTIFGFLFLVFVATTLMSLIKRSINHLWQLKVREGGSIRSVLAGRGLSFLIVLISGILFLLSLLSDAFLAFLGNQLDEFFGGKDLFLIKSINFIFSVLSITCWFSVIFKLLPNARIGWKPALMGGFCTSLLFSRSEEHTSELQSLMRISYAVFCLKQKNQTPSSNSRYNTTRHYHRT